MAKAYLSPTGSAITSTLERLSGRAHISGISDTGEPEFSGGTDVFWDEQETETDAMGDIIFLDDEGNQWAFKDLVPEPDQPADEE